MRSWGFEYKTCAFTWIKQNKKADNGFASKDNPDPDTRAWKQSQITYTDGLKAGDMVLVQKLNDNNKYVIIARVVEA